jgi:hypothetical protein
VSAVGFPIRALAAQGELHPAQAADACLGAMRTMAGPTRRLEASRLRDKRRKEPGMMNFGYNSLWGVLILAGDIWAIINIFQSSASNSKKLIWTLAVVLLPVLGLILWFFLGPRGGKA